MSKYTSQGTIRMHYDSGAGMSLTFVPENDYSIKHGKETFAVFVLQPSVSGSQSVDKAVIRKYTWDDGVHIDTSAACKDVICSAAAHLVKVQVQVEVSEPDVGNGPELTGITVPAK